VQRIFVGDVQGCAAELDDLIERARADFGGAFELWLVGDLVNRGPSSLRVLERARALADAGRARVVLGNHELALLRVALGLRALTPEDTFRDALEAGGDWLDWLRALPLVETGQQGEQRFAMVHAASAPGWSLDDLCERARRAERRLSGSREDARELLAQRPRADDDADALARITRCRSVDARGRWSSREPASAEDAWHRRWLAGDPPFGIVYGHWATQGLHVAPLLRGLDTGCVYNGTWGERFLTAWLPKTDGRPFDVPDDRFWRVPARGRYAAVTNGEESA
jgi:bis(5'-nucleosyl)-tetraphosphatase (symmetrical)